MQQLSRLLSAGAILLIPAVLPARAQENGADADAGTIVVTGTRTAERTAAGSPVPIDVISNEALASVASGDLSDKLSALAPAFSVQRLPLNDGAIFVRPAQLRGLSPDQTLVLVNGRRRARSAYIAVLQQGAHATDLSQIPQIALSRVEVLRDGASAQYGSDAIAGVINLILEERPGVSGYVQAGQYYKGDGEEAQAALRVGLPLGDRGVAVVSGEYRFAGESDTGIARYKIGDSRLEAARLFVNAKVPLGDWELYGFGNYGRAEGRSEFAYRGLDSNVYRRSFFQDNPPFAFPSYRLADRFPNGFIPKFASVNENVSAVAGVRGDVTPTLRVDLAARYARDTIRYRVLDSINASLGPQSPTDFYAGRLAQEDWSVNADLVWQAGLGLARPLNIAFGGEWRSERYIISPGEPDSYRVGAFADLVPGSSSFPGIRPDQSGSFAQRSIAAYLDLDQQLSDSLTLTGAGRFEHYATFGDAWTWKFAAVYRAADWLNLRASASTGFRAPTPGQQNLTNTVQNPDPAFPPPAPQVIISSGLIPSTSPVALTAGGSELQPERSRSFSAGVTIQPGGGVTLSIDAYRVHVDDRIGITQFFRLTPAQRAILTASGVALAASLDQFRFFQNGFATRTQGIDAVLSYRTALSGARLQLTGAYNYNDTRVTDSDPRLVTPSIALYYTRRLPRVTATATADLQLDDLGVMLRGRYYGSFVDAISVFPPALLEQASPRAFIDVAVRYQLPHGLALTVGAENFLSTRPSENRGILRQFGLIYPTQRPYAADGGRYYVSIRRVPRRSLDQAASATWAAFQFHGSSSSRRLTGWSAMRART